jgi:soluble cytochrome b562
MTRYARLALAGLTVLALAGWLLTGSLPRTAADDKDKEKEREKAQQEQRATVDKLADAVAKGAKDEIAKQANAIAKDSDLDDVMGTLGTKVQGGFGFPGKTINPQPDGIELKLKSMYEKPASAKEVQADADAFARMAAQIAAVAEVAPLKPPKAVGKNKDYGQWAQDMRSAADELAKAANDKKEKDVEKAVKKLYQTCSDCHKKYKDD